MERDLAHKIKDAGEEKGPDMARRLIKFMFSQNKEKLKKPGKNRDTIMELIQDRNEKEVIEEAEKGSGLVSRESGTGSSQATVGMSVVRKLI